MDPRELINIGPAQRRTGGALGIVTLVTAVGVSVCVVLKVVSAWWYLLLLALYITGVMLVLEQRRGVCPVNARRGRQSMRGKFSLGQETVEDPRKAAALKRVGLHLEIQSLLYGGLATLLVYIADRLW